MLSLNETVDSESEAANDREEEWIHMQDEWEEVERDLQAEINTCALPGTRGGEVAG